MAHSPFCSAEQKATRMELLHDKKFVKHVKIETGCTGSSAAKQAIGGDSGRLDGCVSSVTARRAANDMTKITTKTGANWKVGSVSTNTRTRTADVSSKIIHCLAA